MGVGVSGEGCLVCGSDLGAWGLGFRVWGPFGSGFGLVVWDSFFCFSHGCGGGGGREGAAAIATGVELCG